MSINAPSDLEIKFPIEENFNWWIEHVFSKEDEKAKKILFDIFEMLLKRLKYYSEKLSDPAAWDNFTLKSTVANMDFVREKAITVLIKRNPVDLGRTWEIFLDDIYRLFNQELRTLKFKAFPIMAFLEEFAKREENSSNQQINCAVLLNNIEIYQIFDKFLQEYENFIRDLEGLLKTISDEITNNSGRPNYP